MPSGLNHSGDDFTVLLLKESTEGLFIWFASLKHIFAKSENTSFGMFKKNWLLLVTKAELSDSHLSLGIRLSGGLDEKTRCLGVWFHPNCKLINLTTGALPG